MKQEINDIIKKNLPAQVGEMLQKELQELELLRGRMEQAEREIKELEKGNKDKNKTIVKLEALQNDKTKLDAREKDLDKRERDMEVVGLRVQLAESNKRADMVENFTSSLVRNTIVRESVLGTRLTKLKDSSGYEYMDTQPDNKDTTKEAE